MLTDWQEDWMMFDNYQLKLAENWETLIPEFNHHCVTMQGPKYGAELVAWDKNRCHRWEIVGYPKALYILTAQQHMMRFLRQAVESMLEETKSPQSIFSTKNTAKEINGTETPLSLSLDANANVHKQDCSSSRKWDQLVQNKFFSFGNSSAHFVRASANQPFSAPPSFNPLKAAELVETMYHESADELDLAQTDPAFLQHAVRALSSTAYFDRVDMETRWDWFMDEIVSNYYRRYIWWRQMAKECRNMVASYERYQQADSPENREAYELAVFALHNISIEHLVQQMALVDYSLPFQRGFERNYEWGQVTEAGGKKQPTISSNDAFVTDKLFWSLKGIGFDEHRIFTMEPSFHFRVFDDYLSHADFKDRNRISGLLLCHVSEMAVVDEIRTALKCDRNYNREPSRKQMMGPAFRNDFVDCYQQKLSLPEIIGGGRATKHLRTLCEKHTWPKGRVDAHWIERAEAARQQLNELWKSYRSALKGQQIRKGFPKYFIDEGWDALSAAMRPQNVVVAKEEVDRMRQKVSQPKAKPVDVVNISETETAGLQHFAADKPARFVPTTLREKAKTRGTQTDFYDAPSFEETVSGLPLQQVTTPSKILVKSENLRLFTSMFPNDKGQTRPFSWVHFLSAMVDAGFTITQGSGSAITFKNDHGTIAFHRPHPDTTIDPVMLMMMGKRMHKWFNWSGEIFTVRDQSGSET